MRLWLIGGITLALLSACASSPRNESAGTSDRTDQQPAVTLDNYRLARGDTISIKVYQEPDLSVTAQIDPDGTINFPLVGRLALADKTTSQVEALVEKELGRGFLVDPDVRVTVIKFKPIYVSGQVAKPGAYTYSLGLTAQQALTLAGGSTRFASDKIYIQRHGTSPDEAYRITPDTIVYPGDIITVEERLF